MFETNTNADTSRRFTVGLVCLFVLMYITTMILYDRTKNDVSNQVHVNGQM